MARALRKRIDISKLSPQPIVLNQDVRLPLKVASPTHSTRRHPKTFNFEPIAALGIFANVISTEFITFTQTKRLKTADAFAVAVRKMFRSLADMRGTDLPLDLASATQSQWQTAVQRWADEIDADTSIEAVTRNDYISDARSFLKHLQTRGKIPRFRLPQGVRNADAAQNRKKTLAEVALDSPQIHSAPPPEVIALGEETIALWRQLRVLPDADRPKGMLRLLDLHLSNLRNAAESEIRSIWQNYLQAEALIAEADLQEIYRFLEVNRGRFSRSLGSGRGSRSIFGEMKNLLAYLEDKYRGLVPTRFENDALYRLITNNHSVADISARLHLTTETVVPFLVPILIDGLINVGSFYEMKTDCVRDAQVPGERTIEWNKWRAGSVLKSIDLLVGSRSQLDLKNNGPISAPRALECLLKMRERLVAHVYPEEKDFLLLVRRLGSDVLMETSSSAVCPLTEKILDRAWDAFLRRHPLLSDLPINMDQIRVTVLLKTALETNGDIVAVKQKAKHKNYSSTIRYVAEAATAALNEDKARQVQAFIFVAATGEADEVRARFGVSPEDAARIISQARRKGFGLNCLDDKKGAAPGSVPGKPCDRYSHCSTCVERLVIEDPSVAAEMHAFRAHILTHQARLMREKPDRWREVWGPFALFLNIALERMRPDIRLRGAALAKGYDFSYFDLD